MSRAKIAKDVFLGVAALLRADDNDAVFAQAGKTPNHRAIFGKEPIAVQFGEIGERRIEIIEGVRAFGMPGELDALPRGEVGVNLPPGFLEFDFDLPDFIFQTDPHGVGLGVLAKLIQLLLQFEDRFLEIELVFHALRA